MISSSIINYYRKCLEIEAGSSIRLTYAQKGTEWINYAIPSDWLSSDKSSFTINCKAQQIPTFLLSANIYGNNIVCGFPVYVSSLHDSQKDRQLIPILLQKVSVELKGDETLFSKRDFPVTINKEFLDVITKHKEEWNIKQSNLLISALRNGASVESVNHLLAKIIGRQRLINEGADIDCSPKTHGMLYQCAITREQSSTFTKNLQLELSSLEQIKSISGTALDSLFLTEPKIANSIAKRLELASDLMPLNNEQWACVDSSLINALTVISGPPGTGKSEVIVGIIKNALFQGKSVLYASKNHKAVHVIDERLQKSMPMDISVRAFRSERDDLNSKLTAAIVSNKGCGFKEYSNVKYQYETIKRHQVSIKNRIKEIEDNDAELAALNDAYLNAITENSIHVRELIEREHYEITHGQLKDFRRRAERLSNYNRLTYPLKRLFEYFLKKRYAPLLQVVSKLLSKINNNKVALSKMTIVEILDHLSSNKEILRTAILFNRYHKAFLEKTEHHKNISTYKKALSHLDGRIFSAAQRYFYSHIKYNHFRSVKTHSSALSAFRSALEYAEGSRAFLCIEKEMSKLISGFAEQIISVFPIWGITNLSVKNVLPLQPGLFDLVIIDEGGQCDIPSSIPLLYRAKHAVILGDTKQLRHITNICDCDDLRLQKRILWDIDQTTIKYGYTKNSLLELCLTLNTAKIITLRNHYRCHPDIIGYSNERWYNGKLRILTQQIENTDVGIELYNVIGSASTAKHTGITVAEEAKKIVALLREMQSNNYSGSIGIIAPFRAQAGLLRSYIEPNFDKDWIKNRGLLIKTAHGYQGDERDVVLFSFCIQKNMKKSSKEFLCETENLFNVALTRAREKFIGVGSVDAIKQSGIEYLVDFIRYYERIINRRYTNSDDTVTSGYYEGVLADILIKSGFNVVTQYPIGPYLVDLAIVDDYHEPLAIEIDSHEYHRDSVGQRQAGDNLRDIRLNELGWKLVRFWSTEIENNLNACVKLIQETHNELYTQKKLLNQT